MPAGERRPEMRALCAIMLAAMAFGSKASAGLEPPKDYIAAIVNDTIITRGQVEEFARPTIEPLLRTYQQAEVLEQKLRELLSEALEQMVENQLILDEFKAGGAKVPDAMVEDEIRERIRLRWRDRAALIKELNALGRTSESFRQQIRDEMTLNFMRHKNVASAILISPQKIERYYATNLHQFQLGNQVKLRMIVLKCSLDAPMDEVRKLAQEICDKIDAGASFSEMALIHSEGSEQKQGGDLGWLEEAKTTKGFAEIAAGLKPGQHSPVLGFARETHDLYWMYLYNKNGQVVVARKYSDKIGASQMLEEKKFDRPGSDYPLPVQPQEFRLMLVEDKRPARTEALPEVREKIEKELVAQERERLRKRWVERLRAKAFVRFF